MSGRWSPGLERAMERNARIEFVSTGGEVPGHDESTYRALVERAAQIPLRPAVRSSRLAGGRQLPAIVAGSDLGILTEKPIWACWAAEPLWSSGWALRLAVVPNQMRCLGELLEQRRLELRPSRWATPTGSPAGFAGLPSMEELARMAERARSHALEHLTFSATTLDVVAWAANPVLADTGFKPASRFGAP